MTTLIIGSNNYLPVGFLAVYSQVDLLEIRRNACGLNPAKRVMESNEPRPVTGHLNPAGASSETGLTLYV